jgi:hypothetical protein
MEPPLWSTRNLNNGDVVYYSQQSRGRRAFPGWNFLDRNYDPPQWIGGLKQGDVLPLEHPFSEKLFKAQLSNVF